MAASNSTTSLRNKIQLKLAAAITNGRIVISESVPYEITEPPRIDGPIGFVKKSQARYVPFLGKKRWPSKINGEHCPKLNGKNNPFLFPEPEMVVQEILEPSHRLLLNKFPIIKDHVLIVTREYKPQNEPLEAEDFQALDEVLSSYENPLAFMNCGPRSGASIDHRHIQVMPIDPDCLMETIMNNNNVSTKEAEKILGFSCFIKKINSKESWSKETLYISYHQLIDKMIISHGPIDSHNLLITSKYMILVPRSKETAKGLSINAVGFTGCILIKTKEALDEVKSSGVLALLCEVGMPIVEEKEN